MPIAVRLWTEPHKWVAFKDSPATELFKFLKNLGLIVGEDALQDLVADLGATLMSETHEFVQCLCLDMLSEHLFAAIDAETMLAHVKLDRDLIRDRPANTRLNLISVADLTQISFDCIASLDPNLTFQLRAHSFHLICE